VHRSLGRIGLDEAREEGARSRELLTRRLGRDIDSFAYPYGMRPDHNADTARLLGELGYRSVFIAQHGVIRRGADPLCLPRVKVEGGEGAWLFQLLCRGGMDAWRRVDDNLWRLQRPE
jgi:peptidoglycan/xylan/chitin deacetylase (PgdA/CDA1 family)